MTIDQSPSFKSVAGGRRPSAVTGESPERPRAPAPRIEALEGVRGLAALLVAIYHMTPADVVGVSPLWRVARLGWVGVDLFFVLSGFLITGVLLGTRGRPHYYRNFYARRTLRTFPLYYGVLFGVLVGLPWLVRVFRLGATPGLGSRFLTDLRELRDEQAWLWLFASNVGTVARGIDWHGLSHFWSLAVEEQFYLVWPGVVAWLGPRRLGRACVGAVGLALGSRVLLLAVGDDPLACYYLTPCRLDSLAIGSWLALAYRRPEGFPGVARRARLIGWAGAGLLAALMRFQGGLTYDSTGVASVGFTLLALAWSGVVARALVPGSAVERVFRWRALRYVGRFSYALYVLNRLLEGPVRALVPLEALSRRLGPDLGLATQLAIGLALNLGLAVASWHLLEVHFLRLKRHFESGMTSAQAPGAAV